MPIWRRSTAEAGGATGARINLDGTGPDMTAVLSIKFEGNDGAPFAIVGHGTITLLNAAGDDPAPVNTALPVITGTAQVGASLGFTQGTWTNNPTQRRYQWRIGGVDVPGATGTSLVVPATNNGATTVGLTATLIEWASNNAGETVAPSLASAAIIAAELPAPENNRLPDFSGVLQTGQVLTGDDGEWTQSPTLARQWLRNGANIASATASTYTLVLADEGALISYRVTATANSKSTVAVSSAKGPVAAVAGAAPVLDQAAVVPDYGATGYDRQFVPTYIAMNKDEAIAHAIALGVIASSADAVDYATGNGGGAFASIDAWLTACGETKIGVIGSGAYSVNTATRRYAPKGFFGYGATRPIFNATSKTTAAFFSNIEDITVRYIEFRDFGFVFAAARDTTPGFVTTSKTGSTNADDNPFHSGDTGYPWVMGGTGPAAALRSTRCGLITVNGQSGSSITSIKIRERNTGLERNGGTSAVEWVSTRAYTVGMRRIGAIDATTWGYYRCIQNVPSSSGILLSNTAYWALELAYAATLTKDAPMAKVQETAPHHTEIVLTNGTVNWATSNAATATALASSINARTGVHGYTATASGSAVILTRATTRTFYKITPETSGTIIVACDNLMPSWDIADCLFTNCRNTLHQISDSAGAGHLKFNRNTLVGCEGGVCLNTMQLGDIYSANNTWRDATLATLSSWFQTFHRLGTDYPNHLGFRSQKILFQNNDGLNITSTGNKDGLNAAVFLDLRNALALQYGDIVASHNYCYRLRGTAGQEDCNPFYGKVVGGAVDDNWVIECGSWFVGPRNPDPRQPVINDGPETCGGVFKDPGNTDGFEAATFTMNGNIWEDMPPHSCIMKVDNYNCNVQMDGNQFLRAQMTAAGSDDVYTSDGPPPMSGRALLRYTGITRNLTIRGNIFEDSPVTKAGAGQGPYHIATHNTTPIGSGNIVISHNELRNGPGVTYAGNVEAIRFEDSIGSFASVQTGSNTVQGGFNVRFNINGSADQAGPGGAPGFTYQPRRSTSPPRITAPSFAQPNTLTCSQGTWTNSPTTWAYQWQRSNNTGGWTNVGTNASTLAFSSGDVGRHFRCQVSVTGAGGTTVHTTAPVGPIT
jgi:hypothetical protein